MNGYTTLFTNLLRSGTVTIPTALITHYNRLNLSETDLAVLLHMVVFKEREEITFPTIEQMQARMSATQQTVSDSFQRLMKLGLLSIEEFVEAGVRTERYSLQPLYEKLAELLMTDYENMAKEAAATLEAAQANDVFTAFEQEFGRPLTPMEMEMISGWLDQDQYSDPLIREALKEAVFAGKVHFRYIDRILLEWSRNRVQTPEQAREHAKQFRSR